MRSRQHAAILKQTECLLDNGHAELAKKLAHVLLWSEPLQKVDKMIGSSKTVRALSLAAILVLLPFICSCGTFLETITRTFPSSPDPYYADWHYRMWVIIATHGAPVLLNRKTVRVLVINKGEQNVLRDEHTYTAASVEPEIIWKDAESLTVMLYERGSKYAEEPYNVALLRSGPRLLEELQYRFDHETGTFQRVAAPGPPGHAGTEPGDKPGVASSCQGDFNGDGETDTCLLLKSETVYDVLVLMRSQKTFSLHHLDTRPLSPPTVVACTNLPVLKERTGAGDRPGRPAREGRHTPGRNGGSVQPRGGRCRLLLG